MQPLTLAEVQALPAIVPLLMAARALGLSRNTAYRLVQRFPCRVITYAQMQLGKSYAWGAEGPDAFDCSGLMMRAYQYAGIAIPWVASAPWRQGPSVSRGQEQSEDLLFMCPKSDGPGHVGVVVAPGQMIHAPQTGDVGRYASYAARCDAVEFTRPALLSEEKR
ncbi:C40 family peptidase [Microtetraspora malaysiensis]|uniref:C40 family peptidase n=1 Tax=Microtetraspora malaysiensis TaxID=161358 RepID=A0ABW6SXZ4_9ACTN